MAQVVGGRNVQVFVDATQNIPVERMQSELPHLQSVPATFGVSPLVIAQLVGGRNEHVFVNETQYFPTFNEHSEIPFSLPH